MAIRSAARDYVSSDLCPLYLRHGFEPTGEIRIGAAPLVTPMVRRPRGRHVI